MNPELTTRKFYDKFGNLYWTQRKTNSFYLEKQFRKINKLWPSRGTILDIGCAGGIHIPMFLGIGRHLKYHGLDNSKQFIKTASSRYPQLNFTVGSITDQKLFKSKQFSGFFANSVLMHVPFIDWDEMFTNIERIMKPGSYGYLSLPITHPNPNLNDAEDVRHFTILSEPEQKQYLKSRNYKIVASGGFDGFSKQDIWRWYIVKLP